MNSKISRENFDIQQPYKPSSESEIKFETYRFYLECYKRYLIDRYHSWQNFALEAFQHSSNLQGIKSFDSRWIERFLKISWNTEYLIGVGSNDSEILRINNQWIPIQSYYSVYTASEAFAYVLDGYKADSHHKALRKVADYFVKSGLDPWDKAYQGARGKRGNEHKPVNFPQNIQIPHNLQRRNVTPLEMIAKCLKAEHFHRIDDIWDKSCGIPKYKFDPGYTGLFHFLYRLRIKSNYEEVDLFISEAPESNIRNFYEALLTLCFWSLLYLEILIIRKCKKKYIIDAGIKYININPRADFLRKRIEFYRDLLKY